MEHRAPGFLFGLALLGLGACNGVFGIDEGQLGRGGDDATDVSASNGGTINTGGANAGGTTAITVGGAGGDCTLREGLLNADFSVQDADGPKEWLRFAYATSITLSTIPSLVTGLSMTFTDISNSDANGGIYQGVSFLEPPWDQCVVMYGDAARSSGSGRLVATASFGDHGLSLVVPASADFQSFYSTCRIPVPFDAFQVRLEVDELPNGGTAGFQMHGIAFNHACCKGDEPVCVLE